MKKILVFLSIIFAANNQTPNSGVPTSSAGAHTHVVPLGGSGTALAMKDAWLNVNQFI